MRKLLWLILACLVCAPALAQERGLWGFSLAPDFRIHTYIPYIYITGGLGLFYGKREVVGPLSVRLQASYFISGLPEASFQQLDLSAYLIYPLRLEPNSLSNVYFGLGPVFTTTWPIPGRPISAPLDGYGLSGLVGYELWINRSYVYFLEMSTKYGTYKYQPETRINTGVILPMY
jgi:hypothetical protein